MTRKGRNILSITKNHTLKGYESVSIVDFTSTYSTTTHIYFRQNYTNIS